ncbi:MAG: amidohydrolase, partial [Acidimicrobiia bacterium]
MSEPRANIPWIISVDDHVLEPPNVWVDRLPAEYRDRGPRVIRERGRATDGRGKVWQRDPEGQWADVWYYDDLVIPVTNAFAAAGTASTTTAEYTYSVTTYDELRQGAFLQKERLADMDIGHTEVSACFPNVLTRFCGQTFLERDDTVLGLLAVKAYNDWVID